MAKVLKRGSVFNGWSIKLIGLQLKKLYGIDLGITGNNGKNYFKKRLEGVYNVYFMKHWSSFGEIYDAANQQITNIVKDPDHKAIYEHWRGFAHPEVFDRYSTKAVKQGEYNHNFNTNDGPRLVFAREGQASFVFWGVYELKETIQQTKTKVWTLVSDTYTPGKAPKQVAAPVAKPVVKKPEVKKVEVKKPVAKPAAKKPEVKKPVAKKAPAKKPVAKKAPAKKVVAKKAPAKKPVAKKAPAKKAAKK